MSSRHRWLVPLLGMAAYVPSLVALSLVAPPLLASESIGDGWRSFPYARDITALTAGGDRIWAGTLFGGVIALEPITRDYAHFTRVESCLPDDGITDLAFDATTGDVWAATARGLARLPARAGTWETFDETSSPLASSDIRAVEVDAEGAVWVGTYDAGLYRLADGAWTHFDTANSGLSDLFVTSIAAAPSGELWIGVWGDGVDVFDGATWTNHDPASTGGVDIGCGQVAEGPEGIGLISSFVRVLAVDPTSGDVWLRSDDDGPCDLNALHRFDGATWYTYTPRNSGIASPRVDSVAIDLDGDVWAGHVLGISRFDGETWTSLSDDEYPGEGAVRAAIYVDEAAGGAREQEFWFGDATGLHRLDIDGFSSFAAPGLPDGSVSSVVALPDGAGAAFASRGGVALLEDGAWTVYDTSNSSIPANDVLALALGTDAALWAGTRTGGVARFDGSNWTTFDTTTSAIAIDRVEAIAVDQGGAVWLGGDVISRYLAGAWTTFTPETDGVLGSVRDIHYSLDSDRVWFASDQGVSLYDEGVWTSWSSDDGLPSGSVLAIAEVEGTVWVGTSTRGLARLERDTWVLVPPEGRYVSERVRDLAVSEDGELWVATQDGGVSRRDAFDEWTTWRRSDGLVSDRVTSLSIDAFERVWMGADIGASLFDPNHHRDGPRFLRGDANCDLQVGLSDPVSTFGYLFTGGAAPCCDDAADANDDGRLDITDGIFTLGYLFLGGAPPPEPGPNACGPDPTDEDELDCRDYPSECAAGA